MRLKAQPQRIYTMHENTYAEDDGQADFYSLPLNCNVSFDMPVGEAIEYNARHWLADLQEVVGDHQARDSIISAYEGRQISAEDAFEALAERRLFGKVSTFMEAFMIGYRTIMSRAMYVELPLPEYSADIPHRTTEELMSAIRFIARQDHHAE